MENRNGLALEAALTRATGTAEREAALAMLDRRRRGARVTLGADEAYDVSAFVQDLRERKVTPHIAVNGAVSKGGGGVRRTALDGRTTRHAGYTVSQILRKRIEEVFGWIKAQAGLAKKVRECAKAEAIFTFAVAAYNLILSQTTGTSLDLRKPQNQQATLASAPSSPPLQEPTSAGAIQYSGTAPSG